MEKLATYQATIYCTMFKTTKILKGESFHFYKTQHPKINMLMNHTDTCKISKIRSDKK